MSIDVEEYFHATALERLAPRSAWADMPSRVEPATRLLLELFAANDAQATFFVLGWVAERHPRLVREIADAGHEIASHGYWHELIYSNSREAFQDDVRRSKHVLEDLTGQPVAGFRAPTFSITQKSLWALDVLVEEGYTYDSSIFPIRHDRYGIPSAPRYPYELVRRDGTIVEVPPATVTVAGHNLPVGGGGYFRLLPYRWTRAGLHSINQGDSRPAVFYLHPWELDADQPRLPLGFVAGVRHYGNIKRTREKLTRLLKEFSFTSIKQLLLEYPVSRSAVTLADAERR